MRPEKRLASSQSRSTYRRVTVTGFINRTILYEVCFYIGDKLARVEYHNKIDLVLAAEKNWIKD